MESRACSKCGVTKPTCEFYKHAAQCKACVIDRVKSHRLANLDRIRAYDRERASLPHRIENATRVTREWRRNHRDRQAAHNKAQRSKLEAPKACEGCGRSDRPLEKHHHDYSRPLLVIWFCKPCHVIADRLRRRLETA